MKLKSLFLFFSILLISIESLCLEKTAIAVLELQAYDVPQTQAVILTDRIRHELFQTGNFIVLERSAMDEIFKEHGFQQSGCTSSECLVQAGKILGVENMVAGSLSKIGGLYTIILRMIEVETGIVVATASADCECPIERVAVESTREVALKLLVPTESDQPPIITSTPSSTQQIGEDKGDVGSWLVLLSIIAAMLLLSNH